MGTGGDDQRRRERTVWAASVLSLCVILPTACAASGEEDPIAPVVATVGGSAGRAGSGSLSVVTGRDAQLPVKPLPTGRTDAPGAGLPVGTPGGTPAGTPGGTPAESPAGSPAGDTVACPGVLPVGWTAVENSRPGAALTLPSGRPTTGSVTGWADRPSARCGDTVSVHLAGPTSAVRLAAYRIGWYAGAGARRVWRSDPVQVTRRDVPSVNRSPYLVEPKWPASLRVAVDGRWTPGFYALIPFRASGQPAGPAIPLVVRDGAGAEPLLFKASTLTWAAYGDWGGHSLYRGPGRGSTGYETRARVVSLRRPLTGGGYDQMRLMDLPVVRQLEQVGKDVTYITDEDLDADPGLLLRHTALVVGGHGEYWTPTMYSALLAALGRGVNAAFLGANNLWWSSRLERSPGASAPDRLAVYRERAEDPVAATAPGAATILWPSLGRPQAAVLGIGYAAIGVRGGLQFLDPPAWYTEGTGLGNGSVVPDSIGNEADGYNSAAPNPTTTQVLAAGVLTGDRGPVVVSNSWVTTAAGSAVFAAGTTNWACLPTGACAEQSVPPSTADIIGRLTRNVLSVVASPDAARTHPATAVVPFTATSLLPRLAPAAVGSYGASTDEKKGDD